ncbi:MAG: choice-of-anchor V domain-containing protein, partial [Bacteroidota bacterium]
VELTGAGAQFGFQTVSLINSSNANAGNFTALTSNAKVVTLNGRKYGEQVSRSTSGLFQFQWNAPASGSGDVKFYAAGIACNANGTTSGDQAITSPSLTISEVTTGIVESSEEIISVYPNPAVDLVTINIPGKIFHVSAFDAGGKEVFSSGNINSQTVIPVSGWPDGFYLIRFSGEVNDARIFLKK